MKNLFFASLLFFGCFCGFFAVSFAENFADWKLSGKGQIVDGSILEITGTGSGSGQWLSPSFEVKPKQYYRFSISINGKDTSGGCLPCGINGFSRDYSAAKGEWKRESFCFKTGAEQTKFQFRCGQWESCGTFQFKDIKLEPVVPVLNQIELKDKSVLILGEYESIKDGVYTFASNYYGEGTAISNPFVSATCGFNSNRWTFGSGNTVVYCFSLIPLVFNSAKITANVNYYTGGDGKIEVSKDGQTDWKEVAMFNKAGGINLQLPRELFPLDKIYVRIMGLKEASFQVDSVTFEASLTDTQMVKNVNVHGETLFATIEGTPPAAPDKLYLTDTDIIVITADKSQLKTPLQKSVTPGKQIQKIAMNGYSYLVPTETNSFEGTDYGYYIDKQLWQAEADWKVPCKRIMPAPETKKDILITAAKNDFEDFQIIVKADKDTIQGLTGKVSDLKNGSNVIPASNVEILYAYYHTIHTKTDRTGMLTEYPDALPPFDKLDIPAGFNQPLWFVVKIPENAVAGTYTGTIELTAEKGFAKTVIPFSVKVWDFVLPKKNHLETAYGFNPGLACEYHNAKTDADKRKVVESYWQIFADHRISIYDPVPFDGFSVEWLPDDKEPEKSKCKIDWTRYDAEMSRVIEKYHFTNWMVPGHGLGGGTFEGYSVGQIGKYNETTPQYKAMMTSYYTQLINHLKEKGWLKGAYVYWFDEPEPKQYDFVSAGFAKLKQYAPELGRMITEEPNKNFIDALEKADTFINIWCPISPNFSPDTANQRMAKGERFWWYICCWPVAPYCTEFIDHPATELRVWHWQTWERKIAGTLIWQSNYWTCGKGYPAPYQNPYEDTMSWTSERYPSKWGNGDGRFFYPPLSAAVPGSNNSKPNFEKPVTSIRWEMIREGVEDYEMFFLLDELLKQKGNKLTAAEKMEAEVLLQVPENVSKSMTDFTIDPRPVYEHRNKIGAMIEKLSQR